MDKRFFLVVLFSFLAALSGCKPTATGPNQGGGVDDTPFWQLSGAGITPLAMTVDASPTMHGNVVFAAVDTGIERSTDSGRTWMGSLLGTSPQYDALSIAVDSGG